ncbi:LANO_0G00474g1_1 [Lachancea nothofagi CBS 11611]|uniref:LANO_0G00474g1_1 n=1 Tax=Lachancea nothofagi CBS 11611 TaxID=1266666 RepID=A0A1G4KEK0_9SACH|nr:LANO_0G00474g1_1 [Lachancea nothofagi CBS 11611]
MPQSRATDRGASNDHPNSDQKGGDKPLATSGDSTESIETPPVSEPLDGLLDVNRSRLSCQPDESIAKFSKTLRQLGREVSIRSPIRRVTSQDYFGLSVHGESSLNYGSIVQNSPSSKQRTTKAADTPGGGQAQGSHLEQENIPILTRNYYDDFTSVDWVRDYLFDVQQREELYALKGLSGKFRRCYSYLQDWVLIIVIALSCALLAFVIDKSEELLVDLKRGYCKPNFLLNEQQCCSNYTCAKWTLWPQVFSSFHGGTLRADFLVYLVLSLLLAFIAAEVTLTTKYINPLATKTDKKKFKTMYHAYGSGVPEVKTILSGFVIRKFLGTYTLFSKTVALILAIASGLSVGKEGPYVHLATCVGNIVSRCFEKYKFNGIERRVVLSASAAIGVTLAFGSPLGGVMFSFEEVSYFLPGNQLFKTFFAAIMANLFLRLLDPYGTGKAVLFEVNYSSDWQTMELLLVVLIGAAGGAFGAFFCRFVSFWGSWFRGNKFITGRPLREVVLVALVTAFFTFSNTYTNISVAELLANLASPCYSPDDFTGTNGLCPVDKRSFPNELIPLSTALVIKVVLTSITFGVKVPAGIYVPSMVIGALFGRIFAMGFDYLANMFPDFSLFAQICNKTSTNGVCIDLGIYAMISAGAFMAGITRMNVTLAVIIFELTSSYNYVVPISIAIAVSNLVAHMLEPQSLYEMLIRKNDFPFLDNHKIRNFGGHEFDLKDIVTKVDQGGSSAFINLTNSSHFSSISLREMLNELQREGLVDGCLPVLKERILEGILPAPDLELALDKLQCFSDEYKLSGDFQVRLLDDDEASSNSCITRSSHYSANEASWNTFLPNSNENKALQRMLNGLCDLRKVVERSPVMLDVNSPLSLVELVFTKLGNRSISILDKGEFVGLVHKKSFIDHCRDKRIL